MNNDPNIEQWIVDQILGETDHSTSADPLQPEHDAFRAGITELNHLLEETIDQPEEAPNGTWRMQEDRRSALLAQLAEAPKRKPSKNSKTTIGLLVATLAFVTTSSVLFWKDYTDRKTPDQIVTEAVPETEVPQALANTPEPEPEVIEVPTYVDAVPEEKDSIVIDIETDHEPALEPLVTSAKNGVGEVKQYKAMAERVTSQLVRDFGLEDIDNLELVPDESEQPTQSPTISRMDEVDLQIKSLDALIRIEFAKIQKYQAKLNELPEIARLQELVKQIKSQIQESEQAILQREQLLEKLQTNPNSSLPKLESLTANPASAVHAKPELETKPHSNQVSISEEVQVVPSPSQPLEYRQSLLAKLKLERQRLVDQLAEANSAQEIPKLEDLRAMQITLSNHLNSNFAKCRELEDKIRNGGAIDRPIDISRLPATVVAVNSDWNFFIIDAGLEKGLTEDVEVLVFRDNRIIGTGRVIKLEKSIAVVSGLENSVVGDQVRFNPAVGTNAKPIQSGRK